MQAGHRACLQSALNTNPICELQGRKMGPCSSALSAAAAAAAQRTQFIRVVVFVSLIGILISSQFSTVRALPSPLATTNGDVVHSNSSRHSVVGNSTSELGASSLNLIVDAEAVFRHRRHYHRERLRASNFVTETLRRQREHRKKAVNLRKLSSQLGCLTNVTMCLTVPGWTMASNASTCCSTGLCTDIQFDGLNCGACGQTCNIGSFCCSGVCVVTAVDPNNCGICSNVCTSGVCGFGFCGGY